MFVSILWEKRVESFSHKYSGMSLFIGYRIEELLCHCKLKLHSASFGFSFDFFSYRLLQNLTFLTLLAEFFSPMTLLFS